MFWHYSLVCTKIVMDASRYISWLNIMCKYGKGKMMIQEKNFNNLFSIRLKKCQNRVGQSRQYKIWRTFSQLTLANILSCFDNTLYSQWGRNTCLHIHISFNIYVQHQYLTGMHRKVNGMFWQYVQEEWTALWIL